MSKDNKRLLKYLGILFIAVLLVYKLPHDSYSIAQYMIRPIRYKNGALYLSGIIPLILIIISIKGFWSLERFRDRSKILMLLLVLVIVMPIMNWTLDLTRTSYHWVNRDGLNGVDIMEPNISLGGSNDKVTINISLEVIDYSKNTNDFGIRVYMPDSLSDYVGMQVIELENSYRTHGDREVIRVNESIVINLNRSLDHDFQWANESTNYELYNEKEVVKIIDHGL